MELELAIQNRRSIRSYYRRCIDKKKIEDILNCGRLSPSAKNRQPWYFVVVEKEIKNKIADMMLENIKCYNISEEVVMHCKSSVKATANIIKQAPILVLIFKEKDQNWNEGDNLSIGACVENMCLRATDLGIGSLWIRDIIYVAKDVAKMLGHQDMELNCALSLGYAKNSPKMRSRKKLSDIVEWYKN